MYQRDLHDFVYDQRCHAGLKMRDDSREEVA